MLSDYILKTVKLAKSLFALFIIIVGGIIRYIWLESSAEYFHYHVLPSDFMLDDPKIIVLWTPYWSILDTVPSWKEWYWAIGPSPVINDCNDDNIDNKCLITNNIDVLQKANVILFSLDEIQKVSFTQYCTMSRNDYPIIYLILH